MKRLLYILLMFIALGAKAQKQPILPHFNTRQLIAAVDSFKTKLPIEKLYLQTDKPYYIIGDTLHFSAYLLNGDFLTPSIQSKLLYVELDNSSGKCVKRILVSAGSGMGRGDMALDEKEIPGGSYTLRAYTNWMRNFGEDYIFKKDIYIAALKTSTLVQSVFKLEEGANKDKVQASLRFTNDKMPVTINRAQNTDVQFMPEGGYMVVGIPGKIGFKAIGEDGVGKPVSGKIINSKQQEVAIFKSMHAGMGSFELIPQAGEKYTAIVDVANGVVKNYPLPVVNPSGTVLRVTSKSTDSLELTLTTMAVNSPDTYYLIGQSRGVVCYASLLSFKGEVIKKIISKTLFPTGIARFTLLNAAYQPLNERIVYIDHDDNLQINIATNKPIYTSRDSITLSLQVTDKNGKPIIGRFSLAVTDNKQVRTDSTASNIINSLLLTSDLKGTVEQPGYYLEDSTPQKVAELDNLMLTQGWVGYDWKQVFDNKAQKIQYQAEKEFTIQGRMTNFFTKGPGRQAVVLLMQTPHLRKMRPPQYFTVDDVATDKQGYFSFTLASDNAGRFNFKKSIPTDSGTFKLVTIGIGRGRNTGIQIDNEFKPPVFAAERPAAPWYINIDTAMLNNTNAKKAQQLADTSYKGEGRKLKEVLIKEKAGVEESKNLNGPGEADQLLDKAYMLKAGKITLGDLIRQKIRGFNTGTFNDITGSRTSYRINEKEIRLVIDGIDVDKARLMPQTGNGRYLVIKELLDDYTAEDIEGVELMFNSRYTSTYASRFLKPEQLNSPDYPIKMDWAFIEVTTISGSGPYFKHSELMYLYKPLTFTLPKQFYNPQYTAHNRNAAMGTDLRSTIYWEPDMITDTTGKATVSFYSADKPATYTIIVEGMDMNGTLGYRRQRIKVVQLTTTTK